MNTMLIGAGKMSKLVMCHEVNSLVVSINDFID